MDYQRKEAHIGRTPDGVFQVTAQTFTKSGTVITNQQDQRDAASLEEATLLLIQHFSN